ncbi:MAPEG family protein, partial [Acinetobacter baumannii]
PVLFFAGAGFAVGMKLVDPALVLFAWAFVTARAVQTAIHIGHNKAFPRFMAYMAGVVALIAMWIDLAIRVALS